MSGLSSSSDAVAAATFRSNSVGLSPTIVLGGRTAILFEEGVAADFYAIYC